MKLYKLIPNKFFCGELKLLFESGRLTDFFSVERVTHPPNDMALTKIEKMFVRWALRKYYQKTERDILKQQMLKYAITGEKEYAPFDERIPFKPKGPTIPPSIRVDPTKVGVALQDPGRKEASSKMVSKDAKKSKI